MKNKNCIFCEIAKGNMQSDIILEDEHSVAFFDINPANPYHTLVISKQHYENIYDIEDAIYCNVALLAKKVAKLYEKNLGIKNVQLINSSGLDAQQDVNNFHIHVLPRLSGDGNNIKWNIKTEIKQNFSLLKSKIFNQT